MQLLHWATVKPSGPDNLAAIRFSSLVRVQSLRIFPADSRPFVKCPDIVAETKPETFYLQVFLNAYHESKDKQRLWPQNALVPTMLTYSGGMQDFPLDIGSLYKTNLVILKGAFTSLSLAIYGDIQSPPYEASSQSAYIPRPLPEIASSPLSASLDPSMNADPTQLARALLSMIPNAPHLSLVIRLMFCLKASTEEWEHPEFPHLYADLDSLVSRKRDKSEARSETLVKKEDEDEDVVALFEEDEDGFQKAVSSEPEEELTGLELLERASNLTTRSISDKTPYEAIDLFAERIASAVQVAQMDVENTPRIAELVALILCHSASQHPYLAQSLMKNIPFDVLFTSRPDLALSESTLTRLSDAAANLDIAHRLSSFNFVQTLRRIGGLAHDLPASHGEDEPLDTNPARGSTSPSASPISPLTPLSAVSTSPTLPTPPSTFAPVIEVPSTPSKAQVKLALRLLSVLHTQALLSDALTNTGGAFNEVIRGIWNGLSDGEARAGGWIESMIWDAKEISQNGIDGEEAKVENSASGGHMLAQKLKETAVMPGVKASTWAKAIRELCEEDILGLSGQSSDLVNWHGYADAGEAGLRRAVNGVSQRPRWNAQVLDHSEFIAFVRAFIGVGCVLAVWAWADSVGDSACIERSLGIIRVWQGVEGFREITNHLLLLRQLTMRLGWIIQDNDPPRRAGVLAEKILTSLAEDSKSLVLQSGLSKTIMELEVTGLTDENLNDDAYNGRQGTGIPKELLADIPAHVLLAMRKLSLVANDRLPGALDELKWYSLERREWGKQKAAEQMPSQQPNEGTSSDEKDEGAGADRRTLSLRRLRILRLSLGIILKDVGRMGIDSRQKGRKDSGVNGRGASTATPHRSNLSVEEEYDVLQDIWKEDGHGLLTQLVDLIEGVADDLTGYFKLIPVSNPPATPGEGDAQERAEPHLEPFIVSTQIIEQLFLAAHDAIRLVHHLISPAAAEAPFPPMNTRVMRTLVHASGDIFISGEFADMVFGTSAAFGSTSGHPAVNVSGSINVASMGPGIVAAATNVRKSILNLLHRLASEDTQTSSGKRGSEITLKVLLELGLKCAHGWRGREPTASLLQVFCLVDDIIPVVSDKVNGHADGSQSQEREADDVPDPAVTYWATSVFPSVLPDLQAFFRLLDLDTRLHFMKRLVAVDNGIIGIGEWLLVEDLKCGTKALRKARSETSAPEAVKDSLVDLYHAHQILKFATELFTREYSAASTLNWLLPDAGVAQAFNEFLREIIQCYVTSPLLVKVEKLIVDHPDIDSRLHSLVVLLHLRNIQSSNSLSFDCQPLLSRLTSNPMPPADTELLTCEIGRALDVFATPEATLEKLKLETAESVLSIIQWLTDPENSRFSSLMGIQNVRYNRLCDRIYQMVPLSRADILEEIRYNVSFDETKPQGLYSRIQFPESLALSPRDIQDLLHVAVEHQPGGSMTPKRRTPDVLIPIISPPSALLRSPQATGLTKTYLNNDFRQLRTAPSSRQNTSRLPSLHVDDFETSPLVMPVALQDGFPNLNIA